jgi:hypothetical protein
VVPFVPLTFTIPEEEAMRAPYRLTLVLAGLVASLGYSGRADAGFIPVSRLSQIAFDGLGIGTGGEPGPDASTTSTDLTAAFHEVLSGSSSDVEPGGALDSGEWNITQDTTILSNVITSNHSQSASISTDFGSPLILTSSIFQLDFQVDSQTQVLLEGSLVGSSNPADNTFARVELKQGAVPLFSTSFPSGTFPFVTTLEAGVVYSLIVEASGQVLFNDTTASSANVTLSIVSAAVPEPSSLGLGGIGLVGMILWRRIRDGRGRLDHPMGRSLNRCN